MKKSKFRLAVLISCTAVAISALYSAPLSASANSAQKNWYGSYASGALVTDENCPVVVENELLTFDINEFPDNYYYEDTVQEFLDYGAKVTAKYSFYNPADYTVNMKLAFPFGELPSYAYFYGEQPDDTAKYTITADGKEVERTLRHTFYRGYEYDNAEDVAKLVDGYKQHAFFSPDMPVYEYTFGVKGITYGGDNAVHAEAVFDIDVDRRLLTDNSGYESGKGNFTLSYFVGNSSTITVRSIGKPLENLDWKIYYYNRNFSKHTLDGTVEKISLKRTTFKELALSDYNAEGTVSEADWYNAVIDFLDFYNTDGYCRVHSLDISRDLMRWYEYSLELAPNGRVVNEVTAPVYPDINGYYTPPIYKYEYLLSPAKSWAEFGKFELVINTPYYVTKSSLKGFEKTENGYYYSAETLPEGELEFSLCESEHPKREANLAWILVVVILVCFSVFTHIIGAVIGGIVCLIVYACKKK